MLEATTTHHTQDINVIKVHSREASITTDFANQNGTDLDTSVAPRLKKYSINNESRRINISQDVYHVLLILKIYGLWEVLPNSDIFGFIAFAVFSALIQYGALYF